MKEFSAWDEDYIVNGIPPGEYDWVEFKGSRLLDLNLPNVDVNRVLDELSKQLSAFANSGGGAIVYGIDDNPNGRHVDNGGVSVSVKNGTKEWLEDVIPNAVESNLTNFNVYPIIAKDSASSIEPEKALFVIAVGDSTDAPHQARDKVYYARIGGKSRPISHRMVMDIAGRQTHPEIKVECKIDLDYRELRDGEHLALIIRFRNVGRVFANYVNGWVNLPVKILKHRVSQEGDEVIAGVRYRSKYFDNTIKEIVGYGKKYVPMNMGGGFSSTGVSVPDPLKISRYNPVLPRLSMYAFSEEMISGLELDDYRDLPISWAVYADNAPKIEGKITVGELVDDWKSRREVETEDISHRENEEDSE